MKKTIIFLSIILCLTGCANSVKNNNNSQNPATPVATHASQVTEPTPSQPVPTETQSPGVLDEPTKITPKSTINPQSQSPIPSTISDKNTTSNQKLEMTGNISDIPIHMTLNINGNDVTGSYFYDKYKQNINLVGTLINGKIKLQSDNGDNVEFICSIIDSNSNIKGFWSNDKKALGFASSKILSNNIETKEIKRDGIDFNYPIFKDKTPLSMEINSKISDYLKTQIATGQKWTDDMANDSEKKVTSTYDLDYEIYQCDNYLSVVFHGSYFNDLMPHPWNMCLPINFDLLTGKTVTFKDLVSINDKTIKILKEHSSDNNNVIDTEESSGENSKENLLTSDNLSTSDMYFENDIMWYTLPLPHAAGDYGLYGIDIKYLNELKDNSLSHKDFEQQTKDYILNGQFYEGGEGSLNWSEKFLDGVDIDFLYDQYLKGGGAPFDIKNFATYLTVSAPIQGNWETLFRNEFTTDNPDLKITRIELCKGYTDLYQVYVNVDGKEVPYVSVYARTGFWHG